MKNCCAGLRTGPGCDSDTGTIVISRREITCSAEPPALIMIIILNSTNVLLIMILILNKDFDNDNRSHPGMIIVLTQDCHIALHDNDNRSHLGLLLLRVIRNSMPVKKPR